MTIWFTSDTHFGHYNVIKFCNRPWNDTRNMDRALIANWNAVVAPADTVYHLGDFSFSSKTNTQRLFEQLNGRKHLIIGNHDDRKTLRLEWASMSAYKIVELPGGRRVFLSHYPPYDTLHRHARLHGHIHRTGGSRGFPLDVGVDNFDYAPVSAEYIEAMIVDRDAGWEKLRRLGT